MYTDEGSKNSKISGKKPKLNENIRRKSKIEKNLANYYCKLAVEMKFGDRFWLFILIFELNPFEI